MSEEKRKERVFSSVAAFPSHDSVVPEGSDQHRVLDVAEDPPDVVGVRGAGEVRVQGLPVAAALHVDGLLLVDLEDEFHGVMWVLAPACRRMRRRK